MPNTHSVCLSVYIMVGSDCETADNCGIRHLLEHLHFRRLKDYSQDDLYYLMESLGSSLKGTTYRDFICFSMKVIPCNYLKILNIFSNIISADDWNEDELEQEKKVVLDQIISREEYVNIFDESNRFTFADTPLSFPIGGSSESVRGLSLEQIKSFKKQFFVGSNIFFCLTGAFNDNDEYETTKMLESLEIPVGEKAYSGISVSGFNNRKRIIKCIHTDDDYLDVCISFDFKLGGGFSLDELKVLNCILGEGVGSKLQRKIREENCLTSDIYSVVEKSNEFALLSIRFTVYKSNMIDCIKNIFITITDLKKKITINDLKTSLPFYNENLVMLEDDPEEMGFRLGYDIFICHKAALGTNLNYDEVTSQHLMDLANVLFIKKNCTVTVIGNSMSSEEELTKQIERMI